MAGVTAAARRVGRYEILRVIGRGGMATVYLARQADLDREVALKELTVLDRADPHLARRFLYEARLAGSLSHPNIVTVHDYLERHGTPYIAMEYLPRGSLRPYVGRLSLAQIGGVLHGVLAGLAHAGDHGVVHRDIKPENVMVSEQGTAKIADFGIAKATSSAVTRASLTTAGTTLGTPRYMAPERAMGQQIGPASDLYSVGVMVFELLVGRVPFADTEVPMAILLRHINEEIPAVRSLVPDVDPALSDWVARLLVKEPAQRTPTARAAWDELDEVLVGLLGPRWLSGAELPPQPDGGFRNATPAAAGRPPPALAAASGEQDTVAPAMQTDAALDAPRPARRRRRRGLALATAALVAGAVAGAAVIAARPEPVPRSRTVVGDGPVTLTAGGRWHQTDPDPSLPLPLTDAVAVARDGARGGSVTAGVIRGETAANVSLLPPRFLQLLGLPPGRVPPRARVVLGTGRVEALRYRGLRPGGTSPPLTVYAVPTTAGVATVVCVPRGSATAFASRCRSMAATLGVRGARTYPVGPSPAYARVLTSLLGALERRARTTGPVTPDVLRSRAADYERAARELGRLDLSPADHVANANLVAALEQAAQAYGTAVTRQDAGVRDRIIAARKALDGALAGLRIAGYDPVAGRPGSFEAGARPSAAGSESSHRGVGDSRSDDPSDDAPDEEEP